MFSKTPCPLLVITAFLICLRPAQADGLFDQIVSRSLEADRDLQQQREQLLARLQAAQARVDWAEAGFVDVRKTRSEWPNEPSHYERVRRHQQLAMQRLTSLPLHISRGAIAKGTALNQMLDLLGPVAYEHEHRLREIWTSDPMEPVDADTRARQQLLKDMENDILLPAQVVRELRFETGMIGPKAIVGIRLEKGDVAEELLPINWTGVFLLPTYQPHVKEVTVARAALLADPPPKGKSEAQLFSDLKTAVDKLTAAFHSDYWGRIQQGRASGAGFGDEKYAYLRAKSQIQVIRNAVQRWSQEGRQAPTHEQFAREHPQGQVSLIQLLTFIHERGWRFGEAPAAAEEEYRRLCDACRRYYLALASLEQSLSPLKEDVARIEADQRRQESNIQAAMAGQVSVNVAQTIGKIADAAKSYFDSK